MGITTELISICAMSYVVEASVVKITIFLVITYIHTFLDLYKHM